MHLSLPLISTTGNPVQVSVPATFSNSVPAKYWPDLPRFYFNFLIIQMLQCSISGAGKPFLC